MTHTDREGSALSIASWGDKYMVLKALQVGLTQDKLCRGWQPKPYQTQLLGTLELQFERVAIRQGPRTPSRLQLPLMRRSLISLAADKVVNDRLHTPFKTCKGCDDAVICEMHEQCLR